MTALSISTWQASLAVAWLLISVAIWATVIRLLVREGGKVGIQGFGTPDLYLSVGFIFFFGINIVSSFGAKAHDVTQKDLVHGAADFLVIVGFLLMFLQYRGINPLRQFGIVRLNPGICLLFALGLIVAAEPLIILSESVTAQLLQGKAQSQNVVEFFINASQTSNKRAILVTLALAVLVAPAVEETIFRGYLYGVLKRYIGPVAGAVISAGLFAAMHMNLAALPPLFLLALSLTLAYEATGSLLVNIFMHGLFNLVMLLVMLKYAGHLSPS